MLKRNIHDHRVFRIKLDELRKLVETLNLKIVGEFVQTELHPFSRFYLGKGKIKEIKRFVRENNIDVVIFYNILKSSQKLNLISELRCDVVDRYEIILEIFDKMASDNISKLQIELARLQKLAPYFRLAAAVRFRHDRPFFLSMGEYAYHSQLRELKNRQARLRKQIEELKHEKKRQIEKRKKVGFPFVCITGYYNAGKTSLFNVLTGENKLVTPYPFTTLSSKYQRRYVNQDMTLLFIDTIGFVIDLDPRLIKSFEINLEDIRSSDIILLLLEANEPILTLKIKLFEGIRLLKELGVSKDRIIIVFNKIDIVKETENILEEQLDLKRLNIPWITISAKERYNINGLLNIITEKLNIIKEKYEREKNETENEF